MNAIESHVMMWADMGARGDYGRHHVNSIGADCR